jgi:hypothetical protein
MAITFATGVNLAQDLGAAGDTSSLNTTAAGLLVATVCTFSTTPTFSDSVSLTWNALTQTDYFGQGILRRFWALNPSGSASHTFHVTSAAAISVLGFTGVATSTPFDQQNQHTDNGTSTTAAGSVTPTEDNEVVVASLYYEVGTVSSIGGGFTQKLSVVGGSGVCMAYLIQTTAAAANPTWTLSTGNTRCGAGLATFKAAAGGGFVAREPQLIGQAVKRATNW